jgi:hypothetical protein
MNKLATRVLMERTLTPQEASVLTSAVSSTFWTMEQIKRLVPDMHSGVHDMMRYAVDGPEALKGKPAKYRASVTGVVDGIRRAVENQRAEYKRVDPQGYSRYKIAIPENSSPSFLELIANE